MTKKLKIKAIEEYFIVIHFIVLLAVQFTVVKVSVGALVTTI